MEKKQKKFAIRKWLFEVQGLDTVGGCFCGVKVVWIVIAASVLAY